VCSTITRAQTSIKIHPMVQEGKSWITEMTSWDGLLSEVTVHTIGGDTIIGNYNWKKVYYNKEGHAPSYFAAIREEGQKVYAVKKGEDIQNLLYDFSLKAGDKLYGIEYGQNNDYYCLLEQDEDNKSMRNLMELKNVDTIVVANQQLRRFIFNSNYLEKSSLFEYPTLVWVEGIGSEGGLFKSWCKIPQNTHVYCCVNDSIIFEENDFYLLNTPLNVNSIRTDFYEENIYYDLTGRRLNFAPAKGMYIQNGKKKMMK
jgi:hypothetical protein